MKKSYLWGAFAVMALVSCSQDEVVNIPQSEIKYSVVANKASRADDVFCNKNKPEHFYVSAIYNPTAEGGTSSVYFTEDYLYSENGDDTYSQDNSRYWPDAEFGSLDFYAYVNGDNKNDVDFAITTTGATISNYVVKKAVDTQDDLIYAVKTKQTKTSSKIPLNFRHALSQIVFQAANRNPNIYVEISGVEVHNVLNSGTFTFPIIDTDDKFEDHNQNGAGNTPADDTYNNFGETQGEWTLDASTDDDYKVTFNAIPVPYSEGKVNLTNNVIFESSDDVDGNLDEDLNEELAMLLMPQKTAALNTENVTWKEGVTEIAGGAYFLVNCKIWNVAGEKYEEGDVLLYKKPILIPVNVEWKQGHKYVYTFVFNKQGDGGIDPDDGDPVLVPITYEINVDDFTNEEETEVDMDDDTVVNTNQKSDK